MHNVFRNLIASAALVSSSGAIAAASEPLLYGGARAGSSIEEVATLVSQAKPTVGKKPRVYDATCELERPSYTISGMEMRQCYYFRENRLVMVGFMANVTQMAKPPKNLSAKKRTLLANGYFYESVKHLTGKYGRPSQKEGNPSTAYYRWDLDNGVVVELNTLRAFVQSTSVRFSDGSLITGSLVKK